MNLTPLLIAEIEAALAVTDRFRPSVVEIRVEVNRAGARRVRVRVEGVPTAALLATAIESPEPKEA